MWKKILFLLFILLYAVGWASADELDELRQELEETKQLYQQRIEALERRLSEAETKLEETSVTTPIKTTSTSTASENSFNPAISVILDAKYQDFEYDPEGYALPGFQLGEEASPHGQGFSLGHSEVGFSANVDNLFYGQLTVALAEHEGETEVELEEAFVETLRLPLGLKVKAGRFLSSIGYLNQQHEHAWDFADAPLIYRGLFGNQLRDDGIQISWIAPTDIYLQLGTEFLHGDRFPAGGVEDADFGAYGLFANIGGDIGISHSWQAGLGYWNAHDIQDREGSGHSHDHGDEEEETASFSGDSEFYNIYIVYKWAPNGNFKRRNLTLQFEYFNRKEEGGITMVGSDPLEVSSYDGVQEGFYLQGVYQFSPRWRFGLRYDYLTVDNDGSDFDVLAEAGLDDEGHNPYRYSAMIDWSNSEFSRIRLQYNLDNSRDFSDNQILIQYTMSLGAHGAHNY